MGKIITKQYKKQSLKLHPDKNPQDIQGATERFKQLGISYDNLQKPEILEALREYLKTN